MAELPIEELKRLEAVTAELMQAFDVTDPPIPVELMLQRPKDDMWEQVDVSQLSGTFLTVSDYYSPRMSLARLLARHIIWSQWGQDRDLKRLSTNEDMLRAFARILVMPASMISSMQKSARTSTAVSMRFEVPETDAQTRLDELLLYE